MAYTINLSNGDILATVPDGTRDDSTTNLVLIGKNYTGYGEFIAENFIKVLENASRDTPPQHPLTGQLWYDLTETNLKVYDGTTFKTLGTTISALTEPAVRVTGDMWYDTTLEQVKIFNGIAYEVVGPLYTALTGKTGPVVETLNDDGGNPHVVTVIYVEGEVLGIAHKDAPFTLQTPISGFPGDINPGYQLADDINGEEPLFTATATNSQLLDELDSSQFLRSDENDVTTGTLGVINDAGLVVGVDSDLQLSMEPGNDNAYITNNTTDGRIILRTTTSTGIKNVITLESSGAEARANVEDPLTVTNIAPMGWTQTQIANGDSAQLSLDGTSVMAGDIDAGTNNLVNLGAAVLGTDAVSQDHGDIRYLTVEAHDNVNTGGGALTKFYNIAGDDIHLTTQTNNLQIYQPTIHKDAFMSFHVGGDYAVHFGLDGGTNDLAVGGWSMGNVAHKIHHDGNTGQATGTIYQSSNGSTTVPGGVNRAEISMIGGGGGGASGGDGGNYGGVYGANGGWSRVYVNGSPQYAYGGSAGKPNSHSFLWVTPTITGWGQTNLGGWRTDTNYNLGGDGGGSPMGYGGKGSASGTNAAGGAWGGGGAGGWGQDGIPGNGGMSGMQWTRIFSVTAGQSISWTLGAGGAGGVWGSRNGGRGGNGYISIKFFSS